jgi:hypothetical protein
MSQPQSLNKTVRIAVLALGALLGFVVITRMLPGGTGPRADTRDVLEREWAPVEVLGLTISSPGRFRAITIPVPDELRASIQDIEHHGRNAGQTEMRVTRIEYLDGVRLGVERSAQGAIEEMRARDAVTGLTHRHAPVQVSGLSGVRTTADFRVGDLPAHGEILTVVRGRTLWQVQVLGPSEDAEEIARRVMESVRVQP